MILLKIYDNAIKFSSTNKDTAAEMSGFKFYYYYFFKASLFFPFSMENFGKYTMKALHTLTSCCSSSRTGQAFLSSRVFPLNCLR